MGLVQVRIFAKSQKFYRVLYVLGVGDEAHHLLSLVLVQLLRNYALDILIIIFFGGAHVSEALILLVA